MFRRLSLALAFLLLVVAPTLAAPAHHHRHHHPAHHAPKHQAVQTVKVWVNTNSGVYHFPGQRWYGATAEGQYMSESEAKAAGYRATENGQ